MRFLRMLTHLKMLEHQIRNRKDKNRSSNDVTCVQPHVVASVNYLKSFLKNSTCEDHYVSLGPK